MAGGTIKIADAAHFCATKIESFLARSDGDFFHHDMEDLVAVVDTRAELPDEIRSCPSDVRLFVAGIFSDWLTTDEFVESLAGHLAGDDASQARRPLLIERFRQIAALVSAPLGTSSESRPIAKVAPIRRVAGSRKWVQLRSSNLVSASYDSASHILTVEFHGARVYVFSGVPETIFAGLLGAASHGRYFHQWIRDRYPSRRLS